MAITYVDLYEMLSGETARTIEAVAEAVREIAQHADDDAATFVDWLSSEGDVDLDAIKALLGNSEIEVSEGSSEDDVTDGILYRTATYTLVVDGTETDVTWERSSAGYIAKSQLPGHMPGDVVVEEAEGSEQAEEWVQALVDASVIPSISDAEILAMDDDRLDRECGEEPEQDESGEWGVVDMDGNVIRTYETREDAEVSVCREHARFTASPSSIGGAYLSRSVCHIPSGIVRDGQWSTTYHSPGLADTE